MINRVLHENNFASNKTTAAFVKFLGILIWLSVVGSQQTKAQVPNDIPRVEIAGSQVLHLSSSITSEDYDLYINLPRGYSDTTKKFPVLFLIDAQWDFPLVQALYGQQFYDGFIPEIIIVGITWGGINPDYDKLRAHDLTPTDVGSPKLYGNAPKFLSFIKSELVPYVEKKFRVTGDRTLVGSSYGGLFTLFAMFTETNLFKRYVLTSPAIQWDNKLMYSLNSAYAAKHNELPAKVYMAIGGYENVGEFQKFVDDIKGKNYKNLELQTKVVEGMGHSSAKADGYSRGIQMVFGKSEIEVDKAILESYTGEYQLNPQTKLKFQLEQNRIVAVLPDNSKLVLHAESKTDFYVSNQNLNIHFEKDKDGKVTGFTLLQYNSKTFCAKVK